MDELDDQALLRYSRHILLPEVDLEGQARICQARVLIIGAGGLGCPVALYLAGAGVGHISIADNDTVDLANLQRQIAYEQGDIGKDKAQAITQHLLAHNPDLSVTVFSQRLQLDDLLAIVPQHDLVLDCTDNFQTRQAINRACVYAQVPLVSGAALRFSGQLFVMHPAQPDSPCYHCLYPETKPQAAAHCASLGVFSPLVGVIGAMQAVEALKYLANLPIEWGRLLLYDALANTFMPVTVPKDTSCSICGSTAHGLSEV